MFRIGVSIILSFVVVTLVGCDQTPAAKAHARVFAVLKERQYQDALRLVNLGLQKNPKNRELLEDRMILLLADSNRTVRDDLLDTQKRLDALSASRQFLLDQASNRQTVVRHQVAWLLGMLKDERSVDTLKFLAEDIDAEVRTEAIHSLAKLKTPKSKNLLLIHLRDSNWMVRAESADALAALGDCSASAQLLRTASDKDAYVRDQVLDAMLSLADPSQLSLYLDNLSAKNLDKRTAAALALAKLKEPGSISALVELLKNKHARERPKIASALLQSNLPWFANDFEALLSFEKDPEVRQVLLSYFQDRDDPQSTRVRNKFLRFAPINKS